MDDQETTGEQSPDTMRAGEAWKDVGRSFEQLGHSLAATIQTAWQSEQVRSQAHEMKSGLEVLAKQVESAIKETADSERVKQAAGEATRSMQTAGEQTVEELRPRLIEALNRLDEELQKLIRGMQTEEQGDSDA